jgi:hypothetical protein
LCEKIAEHVPEWRTGKVRHSLVALVKQRVLQIACVYKRTKTTPTPFAEILCSSWFADLFPKRAPISPASLPSHAWRTRPTLVAATETYIDLRYRFADGRARLCFPDLIVDILNRLAQSYGTTDHEQEPGVVGWQEFEATTDAQIETLDEALFEIAHVIAGLAAADGTVVMGKNNELLGFGGMISGTLPAVNSVARALDLEGEKVVEEGTGNVGARHRSAYRLAGALAGSVAVVISQDGGVRFVCQKGSRVTYWEQE